MHKVSPLRSASQAPRCSGRDDIVVMLQKVIAYPPLCHPERRPCVFSENRCGSFYLPHYPLPQTAFEQAVLDALRKLNLEGVSKVNVQRIRRESQ